jgi:hypothetical protein
LPFLTPPSASQISNRFTKKRCIPVHVVDEAFQYGHLGAWIKFVIPIIAASKF